MTVFADTFAFIAWLNPSDDSHSLVARYLDTFNGHILTTEWVFMELADALCAPHARSTVVAFLQAARADPMFEIIEYSSDSYQAGFDLYAARSDKSWSLTDCISFSVMTDRGLIEALTADHHFEQAGFHAVFKK